MPGFIILWHGTVENIPAGWHLCDGDEGTPDLRNKFVPGAGDEYDPGDNDANPTHTHPFTGDGHNHSIPQHVGCPGAGPNPCIDGLYTGSENAAGDTDEVLARPPYYALCYIMKI